jgi:hypothetical protein
MWPFRRREIEAPQPPNFDGMAAMGEAFAKSFAAQIEGNAKIAQVFATFVQSVGEMSIKQAARSLGQRSAAKREGRRERKPNGQWRRGANYQCELCNDPHTANVSVEMIREHRRHAGGGPPPPIDKSPDEAPESPTELGN